MLRPLTLRVILAAAGPTPRGASGPAPPAASASSGMARGLRAVAAAVAAALTPEPRRNSRRDMPGRSLLSCGSLIVSDPLECADEEVLGSRRRTLVSPAPICRGDCKRGTAPGQGI